jgi:hypothetical protein
MFSVKLTFPSTAEASALASALIEAGNQHVEMRFLDFADLPDGQLEEIVATMDGAAQQIEEQIGEEVSRG